jgi:hypothetical protein
MKITLTQVEIELAIRTHINNTITVPEDADLELQFDDGEYTAVIDLHPSEEDKATKAETKASTATKRTYNKKPKADPAPTATLVTPANAAELRVVSAVETTVADSSAQDDAGAEPETATSGEAGQDPNVDQAQATGTDSAAPRTSLFANLSRPKND